MKSSELLKVLEETGAILNGHFLLTSGRHSDRYIEKFRVLENPDSLDKVTQAMADEYRNSNVELVFGAAIGGILIAGGVGRHLGVKHIFSERVDGEMVLRRGFEIPEGTRLLIVEDVITTGGSVFELIKLAQKHKADIVGVVNLVERALEKIDFGVSSKALLHLPSVSWDAENCPLCKSNTPMTQRGRTGK
ncbi:MAG: orotate phosphoribosyltransferase [Candidatus Marinimicrobia bacterium]|nr:orotate phosphoribosyltransferase [Candidatus Neomarinimicrobiota bacterium]MBL7023726.1 orotate phosphoribosyltransferase [Candidatus Neomarinimicrobiota bacterium]MBL7109507.1 orotate phosphoribosyltransferase [Candidatus Neomarinimicrobiota bacterium]